MIDHLNNRNPKLNFKSVYSDEFLSYGKIIDELDFTHLINTIDRTEVPIAGNRYVAHDEQCFQSVPKAYLDELFGEMPVQVGYVNGNNAKLNALEYHKSSEVNIAITDLVLLLGHIKDIKDNTYHTKNVEAFFVPKGTAIEVYGTTLHFAPCKVDDKGFKCAVILPYGTNVSDVKDKTLLKDSKLLFKTNKWLLAHSEHKAFVEQGAHVGLIGENIEVDYK